MEDSSFGGDYLKAHSRLMARFRQLLPELQKQLRRLFEQSSAARTNAFSADTSHANDARTQVRRLMIRSLTPADWQALAQAAVWTLEQYVHSKPTELNREE